MRIPPFFRYVMLGLLMIAALAACSSDDDEPDEPVFTRVTEGELGPGDAIPAPEDDIILTVTGKIGNPNQGDAIVMDLATIERVGEVEYTVADPFREVDEADAEAVTFRGPLMSDLLALWGVERADVQTLHVVALNDYAADVPAADLWEYPVIFALQADGEYMPVATRGPAMLVYPYADFDFDEPLYNNYWVWQIESIDVQ